MMRLSPAPLPPITIEDVRNRFRPDNISGLQLWLNSDVGAMAGGAGQFTAVNSEYLSIADNASVSTGDIDFFWAGWVYLDTKASIQGIASKYATNQQEWYLRYNNAVDRFQFSCQGSLTGTGAHTIAA